MMQKILFTEFAELKQGDGKGPKFYPGKAYWLSPDQAERWKAEGIAEDAPDGLKAENEPDSYIPRPDQVRLVRGKSGRYDVLGPNDHAFNRAPLSADEAEKLRARVLNGEIDLPVPRVIAARPAPKPLAKPAPKPEPIQLRAEVDEQSSDGLSRKLFVASPWPQSALFSDDIVTQIAPGLKVDGDTITITVENGMAVYRKTGGDPAKGVATYERGFPYELVDQIYEPPPPVS